MNTAAGLIRWHSGDAGKHARDPRHESGRAIDPNDGGRNGLARKDDAPGWAGAFEQRMERVTMGLMGGTEEA